MRHHRRQAQRGQTVVIVALGMVAFLGFLGLALDGGSAYLQQQDLQKAADLAAVSATWAYYHANYQEADMYGNPYSGMQAAGRARDATLAANGYGGINQSTFFVDAAGSDIAAASTCQPGGASCPQPWEVRGVRVHLSKVLPTQVLQAVGVGNSTIAAEARAELGPNTGARHEAPLLLQNCNASRNLSRATAYPAGPCASAPGFCASNPADGFRYPMSTDCRPSTRRSWTLGQPMSLEPAWGGGAPRVFPFDQPYAPVTAFFLLHEPAGNQPPANTAAQAAVTKGLDEFLPTCAPLCSGATTVYADTQAPATDPVPAGMGARIGNAAAGKWRNQDCANPHDAVNPLSPDNPRLLRLPVTYATNSGAATADPGIGGFLVSETVMFCLDNVQGSGAAYTVSGYLVEEPSAEPTVLRPGDPYFGRDVVVKLLS